jgi:heat shock protein HslJ
MTRSAQPTVSSRIRPRTPSWLALALLGSSIVACGAQANDSLSTDTGNPPAIDQHQLHVEPEGNGVVVYADAGAVTPGGAKVLVENTTTGKSASTTADENGSFSVELPGSADDGYEVTVSADGKSAVGTIAGAAPPDGTSSGDSDEPGGAIEAIVGHEYLLDSATNFTLVPDTSLHISFREDSFSFSAGCNSGSGEYTFCDGQLCIDGLGTTEIGCDAPRHEQDETLANFFTSKPLLSVSGDELTISSGDVVLFFLDREVANPDRPLTGSSWVIDSFIQGDGVSNLPLQQDPTLSFNADGTFSVFTTCNQGSGTFVRTNSELSLSEVIYTEAECGDTGSSVAEGLIQDVLQEGVVTIEIDAQRLTIQRGDIGLSAMTE